MFGENEHLWRSFYAEHSEDGYIFRTGVEKRYFGDKKEYYQHFEAQMDFNVYSDQFYLGIGFRTIDIEVDGEWVKEHRPMINATFKYKRFKNRSRVTYRIKPVGDNIWRFRNKISLTLMKPIYIAYEIFADYGKPLFYRNRMSAGVKYGFANIFYLFETISGETKHVIGTYFKVRF